jgi:lipopolysaccharide/colanic/teichoic acid biosynthesis glycosyltransferase
MFWFLSIGLVGAGRFTLRRVAYALRRRGWFIRRVLIVGASDQGLAIAQQLHSPLRQGVEVAGFLDDYAASGTWVAPWQGSQRGVVGAQFPVLGHPREAQHVAAETQTDLLIAVPAALSWESQQLIVHLADARGQGPEVRLAPTHYDLDAAQLQPASLGFVPLVRVHPARLVGVDALLRAVCDVGLAAVLLVAVAPVLLAVLAVAWLRGTRPLLTRKQVLGQGAAPVTLYLLDRGVSDYLVLRGSPALLAVLQGRLALVGPRPLPVDHAADHLAWFSLLLSVKPGLTGPWRLAQPELSPGECLLADIWWVRNWSIWQHLFVLVQTVHRVWHAAPNDHPVQRWEANTERRLEEVAA